MCSFIFAFLLVKFPLGQNIVKAVSDFVTNVLNYGFEGVSFVFGSLADGSTGYIFAIDSLYYDNLWFFSHLLQMFLLFPFHDDRILLTIP